MGKCTDPFAVRSTLPSPRLKGFALKNPMIARVFNAGEVLY